jgi:hypothetical protein
VVVVYVLRFALLTQRTHAALCFDHRVKICASDAIAASEVVLPRAAVQPCLALFAASRVAGFAIGGEAVGGASVFPERRPRPLLLTVRTPLHIR